MLVLSSNLAGKLLRKLHSSKITQISAAFAALIAFSFPADAAPQRIVSLNVCADQLLYTLVDKKQITALSHLSRDPKLSNIAREAQSIPTTNGNAEAVIRLNPDLVIAGAFTTRATVNLLKKLGRNVLVLKLENSIKDMYDNLQAIGTATGTQARANELIASLKRRVETVQHMLKAQTPPKAMIYYVNSYTSGKGTLVDDVVTASGLSNVAADAGLSGFATFPLERLIIEKPDVILLGHGKDDYRTIVADNLSHPALSKIKETATVIRIAARKLSCATPETVDVIERLARVAHRLGANR